MKALPAEQPSPVVHQVPAGRVETTPSLGQLETQLATCGPLGPSSHS